MIHHSHKKIQNFDEEGSLASILDEESFTELPFFYKKNIHKFLSQMDKQLNSKNNEFESLKHICVESLELASPMITLSSNAESIGILF